MKLCMTVEEAAEAASVSYEQIQKWAKDIDFPEVVIGAIAAYLTLAAMIIALT